MIKNIFLMLLVCGVCFSCHSPQQEKQQEDLTKANKNMTNEQLREKLVMALGDMKAKALRWVMLAMRSSGNLKRWVLTPIAPSASILAAAGPSWTARNYWV